jgi:hypothetical protein
MAVFLSVSSALQRVAELESFDYASAGSATSRTFVRADCRRFRQTSDVANRMRSTESRRRSRFSYWVTEQRIADWSMRAVVARAALAALALAALVGSAVKNEMPPWWAWLLVAVPFVGAYLAGSLAYYVMTGRKPREPLARWGCRVGVETQGSMGVNVSGIAESIGAVCLGVLGPWVLTRASVGFRIVAVIAAAGWLASLASAIMVDVAWYNPDGSSWLPLEYVRRSAGIIAALVLAAVTLPAPWPADGREAAAIVCAALVTVQLRINETDRTLVEGAVYAGQRDMDGRRAVTAALHTLVGNPLIHLKRQAAQVDQALFDLVRQVEGGYRETLALDRGFDVTIDWPGVLASRLDAIAGQYGINVSFSCPSESMAMQDREVARFVLDDLTENAAKAGARTVDVALRYGGRRYEAVVTDDGPGFRSGTWLRPGGGLERLMHLLESRDGGMALSSVDETTVITADWQAVPREGQGEVA